MKNELVKLNNYADNIWVDSHKILNNAILYDNYQNPLNIRCIGMYSQCEEDSILLAILKRMELLTGTFAEFGVGEGSENNTLMLAALGFRGFWVGGEDIVVDTHEPQQNFKYIKHWVTKDNVISLFKNGIEHLDIPDVDVLSLDLDGNDIFYLRELLTVTKPKIIIVEYNGKFPPPVLFEIDYNPNHKWDFTDYFGASLQTFVNELTDYRLVCCNKLTGVNAFFVLNEYSYLFDDVSTDIDELYQPPRYDRAVNIKLWQHPMSPKTVSVIFKKLADL